MPIFTCEHRQRLATIIQLQSRKRTAFFSTQNVWGPLDLFQLYTATLTYSNQKLTKTPLFPY